MLFDNFANAILIGHCRRACQESLCEKFLKALSDKCSEEDNTFMSATFDLAVCHKPWMCHSPNRPFSYSTKEPGSSDIFIQFHTRGSIE